MAQDEKPTRPSRPPRARDRLGEAVSNHFAFSRDSRATTARLGVREALMLIEQTLVQAAILDVKSKRPRRKLRRRPSH